jgi:hypothetical protein
MAFNGNSFVGIFILFGQVAFNVWRLPILYELFEDRLKKVIFKTQIENLYVVSLFEGQEDSTVTDTFKATIDLLKVVENKHEVRVHLIIFQDVSIFTWFWDISGKLVKSSKYREGLPSSETWDEYQTFLAEFEAKDRDERLRAIRKDSAGFDWVNENIFKQSERQ